MNTGFLSIILAGARCILGSVTGSGTTGRLDGLGEGDMVAMLLFCWQATGMKGLKYKL